MGRMSQQIGNRMIMNHPHIHPNSLFSGVYYVKSNPQAGRLKIHDPRPGAQIVMPARIAQF